MIQQSSVSALESFISTFETPVQLFYRRIVMSQTQMETDFDPSRVTLPQSASANALPEISFSPESQWAHRMEGYSNETGLPVYQLQPLDRVDRPFCVLIPGHFQKPPQILTRALIETSVLILVKKYHSHSLVK